MEMGFLSNTTYTLEKSNESFNRIYAIFEICLFFATFAFIPFVLGVIYLMWKYPQFHTNLVILVSNLFISYGVLTIARQIVFIETYLCGDSMDCYENELFMLRRAVLTEIIKFTSIIAYFVASNWIIIERIWAIVHLKGYENKNDYKIIVICVAVQWVISAGGITLAYLGYLPILVFIIPGIFLTIATVVVYRYMDNKNKRRYRLSKSVGNSFALTERYQMAENIKTSPFVHAMINIHATMNLIIFGIATYLIFTDVVVKKQITKMVFDFILTIYPPTISIYVSLSIPKWRNAYIGLFVKKVHKIAPKQHRDTVTNVANVYVTSPQLEADIYFQQLNTRWA